MYKGHVQGVQEPLYEAPTTTLFVGSLYLRLRCSFLQGQAKMKLTLTVCCSLNYLKKLDRSLEWSQHHTRVLPLLAEMLEKLRMQILYIYCPKFGVYYHILVYPLPIIQSWWSHCGVIAASHGYACWKWWFHTSLVTLKVMTALVVVLVLALLELTQQLPLIEFSLQSHRHSWYTENWGAPLSLLVTEPGFDWLQ